MCSKNIVQSNLTKMCRQVSMKIFLKDQAEISTIINISNSDFTCFREDVENIGS